MSATDAAKRDLGTDGKQRPGEGRRAWLNAAAWLQPALKASGHPPYDRGQ